MKSRFDESGSVVLTIERGDSSYMGIAKALARRRLKEENQHLLEAGFTGVVKDKNGTEYHYVNGKRVAAGDLKAKAGAHVHHMDVDDDKKADALAASVKNMGHTMAHMLHKGPMDFKSIVSAMQGGNPQAKFVGKYQNALAALIKAGVVVKNGQNQFMLAPKGGGQPAATQTPQFVPSFLNSGQPVNNPAPTPQPATPAKQPPQPTPTPPLAPAAPQSKPNPYQAGTLGHTLYGVVQAGPVGLPASQIIAKIVAAQPGVHKTTGKFGNALKAMVAKGHLAKTANGSYFIPQGGGGNAPATAQASPMPQPTPAPTPAQPAVSDEAQLQALGIDTAKAAVMVSVGGMYPEYARLQTTAGLQMSYSSFATAVRGIASKPPPATAPSHQAAPLPRGSSPIGQLTAAKKPAKPPVPTMTATQYLASKWTPGTKVGGGRDNKFKLEPLVAKGLEDLGLKAEDMLSDHSAQHKLLAHISSDTDGSVGRWDIEYSLKNIYARGATRVHKPLFKNFGGSNGPSQGVPDEARPQLSPAEKNAAQKYTSTAYRDLNDGLRTGSGVPADLVDMHHHLQAAFAKAQPFAAPVDVTRGMTLDDSSLQPFLNEMKRCMADGNTTRQGGYISTMVGTKTDPNFNGNVTLRIKAMQGIDLKPYTNYPHVKELLLNHNAEFKVSSVKQVYGGGWEVEMEQVAAPVGPQAPPKPAKAKSLPVTKPTKDFAKAHESDAVKDYLSGKLTYRLHSNRAGQGADLLLQDIMKESGRDQKPQVLDKAGIDALHAKGWLQSFRGVKGAKFTKQFRTGTCFAGSGIYGNGIYTDVVDDAAYHTVRDAQSSARSYGKNVMRFAIDPKARTIDHSDLKKRQAKDLNALDKKHQAGAIPYNEYTRMKDILEDDGRWAALNNFDLIRCNDKKGGYNVILNRAIVAVEDKDQ